MFNSDIYSITTEGASKVRIRNSAKALIVKEEKLLTLKMYENGDTYYILPGGGQEHGENLMQALERECIEEIGAKIEIGELIFVREYIGINHGLSKHSKAHQTEFMFLCHVDEKLFENGTNPDNGQIGVEWLPINELLAYKLFPQDLRAHLISYFDGKKVSTYLGDIN